MKYSSKTIEYKGRVVFQKVQVSTFKRLPKEYFENEACIIFVQQGEFYIRSQSERLLLNQDTALLAKCLNYFYETTKKSCADEEEMVKKAIGLVKI